MDVDCRHPLSLIDHPPILVDFFIISTITQIAFMSSYFAVAVIFMKPNTRTPVATPYVFVIDILLIYITRNLMKAHPIRICSKSIKLGIVLFHAASFG
jgi:hypothetical protein